MQSAVGEKVSEIKGKIQESRCCSCAEDFVEGAEETFDDTMEHVKDKIEAAKEKTADKAEEVKDKAAATVEKTGEKIQEVGEKVEKFGENHRR